MTDQTISHLTTRTTTTRKPWNTEFLTVAGFCAIGLLVMLNVMLRFPEVGTVFTQFNQF